MRLIRPDFKITREHGQFVSRYFVHDLLDDEVPWDEGERFARHLTAARLLTTLDLGHHGVLNDPTVLRDCLRFLKGEAIGDKVVSSPNLPYGVT